MAIRYLSGINVDSNTLFVDDANNRVGIGTATPSSKLDVVGAIISTGAYQARMIGAAGGAYFGSMSAVPVIFQVNQNEVARFDASGQFSIATTTVQNPAAGRGNITIGGTSSSILNFGYNDSDNGYIFHNGDFNIVNRVSTKPLIFGTEGAERMRITSSGNVGIGTTSPGDKLTVSGGITGDTLTLNSGAGINVTSYGFLSQTVSGQMTFLGHNVRASTSTANTALVVNSGWYSSLIKMYYSDGITFHTSATSYTAGDVFPLSTTERMRIRANGSILFNAYGAGSITGTAAYGLAVDSSGNVIEVTSTIDGSGTANYVTKWQDSNTLTNSIIYDNGTNVGIGITNPDYPLTVGSINVGGAGANLGLVLNSVISTAIPSSSVKAIIGATNSGFGYAAGSLLIQPRTGVNAVTLFATEGTEKMRITHDGNVGINTTSPSYKLDVIGSVRSYSGFTSNGYHGDTYIQNILPAGNNGASTGNVQLRMWCSEPGVTWDWAGFGYNVVNDGTAPYGFARLNSNFGQAYMRFSTDGSMYFYNTTTSNVRTTTMTLSPTGNVGIGTTSPDALLNVGGGDGTPNATQFTAVVRGTSTRTMYFDGGGSSGASVWWGDGNTPQFAIDSINGGGAAIWVHASSAWYRIIDVNANGNVGINQTAPTQKLDVFGNISLGSWTKAGNTYVGLRRADDGTFGNGGDSGLVIESYNHAAPYNGNYSQKVHLRTHLYNGGSHDVITGYGLNVGIGTSTPNEKLHVGGNISVVASTGSKIGFNTTDAFAGYSTSIAHYGISYGWNTNPLALSGYYGVGIFTEGSEKVRILGNGNVGIGTTSPGYKLTVSGTINVSDLYTLSASADYAARYRTYAPGDGNWGLLTYASDPEYHMVITGASASSGASRQFRVYDRPAAASRFVVNFDGSGVGVGTSGPTQQLHVAGNIRVTGAYYDSNNEAGTSGQVLSSTGSGTDWVTPATTTATSLYDLLPAARVAYNWTGQVVNDTWVDIFSAADNVLTTGTWLVQMYISDWAQGGAHYTYTYTGTMQWYQAGVNQGGESAASEIYLHRMGHAANSSVLYLRTTEMTAVSGGIGKLQVKANYSNTSNTTINFKFVKIF